MNELMRMQEPSSSQLVAVQSDHFAVSSEFRNYAVVPIQMFSMISAVVVVLQAVWIRKYDHELNKMMKREWRRL